MENGMGLALASPQEQLQQRLNDPDTAESLLRILDKLDVIALSIDSVDGFLQRGDEIIENVVEGVAELKDVVPADTVDVQQTVNTLSDTVPTLIEALPQLTQALPRLLALAEKINDPDTAQALDQIMNHLDFVAFSLDAADGFLQRSEIVIESLADGVQDIRTLAPADEPNLIKTLTETLPQLTASLPQLVEILPQLTAILPSLSGVLSELQTILESEEFDALMRSGVFSPKTVGIVGEAGNALVDSYEAHQTTPKSVGMFGVLGAMRDPDVQRALGFFVEFGKRFGQKMNQ